MGCTEVKAKKIRIDGNYSFQKSRNVEISDSVLNSKDAFWESDNVTVRDSVLKIGRAHV